MKSQTRSPKIKRLVARARGLGFDVEFVEFVACGRFPMAIPPQGMCIQGDGVRLIRVATRGNSREKIAAILEHELEHAEGVEQAEDVPRLGLKCGGTWRNEGSGGGVVVRGEGVPA